MEKSSHYRIKHQKLIYFVRLLTLFIHVKCFARFQHNNKQEHLLIALTPFTIPNQNKFDLNKNHSQNPQQN